MPRLSNIKTALRRPSAEEEKRADPTVVDASFERTDKEAVADNAAPVNNDGGDTSSSDLPAKDAQRGVQEVEAVTMSWSKAALIGVFLNIWLLYFVNAFQSAILNSLTPYVTSDFESHSLLNVIDIVAGSMTAAVFIPLSKILDIWGRAEGFVIMVVFATLGLVLMAACDGLAMFCAANVFYKVGFTGMTYSIDVITADSSQLKNRGLAYAFTSSPYIITAFAGPKAAEDFLEHVNWRWGFGCFSIIFPVVAAPLFFVLKYHRHKARKQGLLVKEKSGRTWIQSIWHYVVQFDALGVFLFSAGLTVFLLPFTLAGQAPNGWGSDYIIAMIVVGFVLLCAFGLYESFWAPVPMITYKMLADRTVIGTCMLSISYQVSYYCWANYFSSFLQAVNDLTVSQSGYIDNTFSVVSGVLLFIVGFLIRKTSHFKWLLYIAVPLYTFAQGLMIYFRRPDQSVGYLIMCEVFISIAGSTFIIVMQVAMLAAVDHQHVAAALSLLNVVGTTGYAVGATISGTIWTNTFRKALIRYLPESALPQLDEIYEQLDVQLSFADGTPIRRAIQEAYGYAQTRMLAAGTSVMAVTFVGVLLMRNINVAKVAQVKGVVF
ncbi:general substrate transporter [Thermothelomyces thermophilus ATCC 42464]|uniref:General substrate transporter n=1 Tax=Thermothelomyces thermophilus (strain ATCC 42464 / BCRC 31852 / DSM 1799) TaxID=573729 RepID=G2PZL9_THET4|nr:general substrate transporter [Thermothelomyces thermophilus ATCC 42464]AEO55705.1 general substrate transporter [Thermothelomyces thermophilus ATCC 42464]